LNDIRVIANRQFENLSASEFKFTYPVEKPSVFLGGIFQVSLGYGMNISRETVTRNSVNNAVC
jgi:hypothetical protein